MRKMLCVLVLLIFACFVAEGAIVLDDGLILQGGAERIIMDPGERVYLRVQNSIWKYPVLKGLEFSSSRLSVAYVDRFGWVRALMPGRAVISVWNAQGDNGTIEILVRSKHKVSPRTALVIAGGCVLFFIVLRAKKFRCF